MRKARLVLLASALVAAALPAPADEFVDVLGSKVWVRKGGLACDSAEGAAAGGGFFSNCQRLPRAMRVVLIDTPLTPTQVYYMRVLDAGEKPMKAWFARDSLTNNPTPVDFVPD